MKHKHTFFAATGIPSLFLIFAVLCLAVFSLLTLGSSRSALNSARLSMEQTDSYYKACAQASEIVSSVSRELARCYSSSGDEKTYYSLAAKLPDQDIPVQWDQNSHTFSFRVSFSDTQELSVTLKVLYPQKEDEAFAEIQEWKTDNTSQWTPDNSQSVFKGGRS